MNYHNITKEDMLNGDGIRVVLWVSGCDNCCNGCHNPITWDKVIRLVKKCRSDFPNKTIWLYTGLPWEEIKDIKGIELIDVIAEGRFVEELKDNNLKWVGSSNQRVIDVKKTLEIGSVVLYT